MDTLFAAAFRIHRSILPRATTRRPKRLGSLASSSLVRSFLFSLFSRWFGERTARASLSLSLPLGPINARGLTSSLLFRSLSLFCEIQEDKSQELREKLVSSDSGSNLSSSSSGMDDWGRKSVSPLALTVLTSSQGLLIAASKANGVKYDYAVTSANCTVETTKMLMSLLALVKIWRAVGVN